ncbi:MAG: hypothetical protein JWL88_196 [Parcubacteria group bacterium]|nr:hypothetical protein [Parcubacteria group bacterium]
MKFSLPKGSGSKNSFRYGEKLDPARDWLMLILAASVLFAASIGWNLWLFIRVTNGDAIGNATATKALNPTSITSVNALFQQRADIETQYKNAHFADPAAPQTPATVPAGTLPAAHVDPAAPAS